MRYMLFLIVVFLAPDRPIPPTKKDVPTIPKLVSESNWGRITQAGRAFKLDGHPNWFGEGLIRPDGKTAYILWTLRANDRPAPGVYQVLPNGELIGEWGYGDETHVDDDGVLHGQTSTDRVYAVMPRVD